MNKTVVNKALKNMNDDETRIKYIAFLLRDEASNTLAYLDFIKMIINHNKVDPLESIIEYITSAEKETKKRNGINE